MIICVQQQVMSLHFSTLCFVFALYVQHAYLSLGLTHACNHANEVSGVNEYIFHVGHPWVSLKMLNMYLIFIFIHN